MNKALHPCGLPGLLAEQEKKQQSLHAEMDCLRDTINRFLKEHGVRFHPGGHPTPPHDIPVTVHARTTAPGKGVPSIWYHVFFKANRKFRTRTRIVEVSGNCAIWIFRLPEGKMGEFVELDRHRRQLNHRARVASAELRSLARLLDEEQGLDHATGRPIQTTIHAQAGVIP